MDISNTAVRRPLAGRVAVVTGASRGAGRGIAIELGSAGATVYVTGRSVRGERTPGYDRFLDQVGLAAAPGSIEDTADEVTLRGGIGVPVRCDHTKDDEVHHLFAQIDRDQGRLDLLVNNAWGGHREMITGAPFWEQPMSHWEGMFDRGVRNHFLASRMAAPLLLRQGHGLIVTTTSWDRGRYLSTLFYDVAKAAMNRLAYGLAEELRPHGVASVAVAPGWMRTEFVLANFDTDEEHWRDVPELARTETPHYVGRAVAALASDPEVLARSGEVLRVGDLALEYGFTDVDGRVIPPWELDA